MKRVLSVVFVLLSIPVQSANRVVPIHIADFTLAEYVSINPEDQQVLRQAMATAIDQTKKARVVPEGAAEHRLTVAIVKAHTVAEMGGQFGNFVAMVMVADLEVTDLKAQRTLGRTQVKELVAKRPEDADRIYSELTRKIGKKVAKFVQSVAK